MQNVVLPRGGIDLTVKSIKPVEPAPSIRAGSMPSHMAYIARATAKLPRSLGRTYLKGKLTSLTMKLSIIAQSSAPQHGRSSDSTADVAGEERAWSRFRSIADQVGLVRFGSTHNEPASQSALTPRRGCRSAPDALSPPHPDRRSCRSGSAPKPAASFGSIRKQVLMSRPKRD